MWHNFLFFCIHRWINLIRLHCLAWLDCCVYINTVMFLEAQTNKISLNATIMTIQYIKWSQAMQSNKRNEDLKKRRMWRKKRTKWTRIIIVDSLRYISIALHDFYFSFSLSFLLLSFSTIALSDFIHTLQSSDLFI